MSEIKLANKIISNSINFGTITNKSNLHKLLIFNSLKNKNFTYFKFLLLFLTTIIVTNSFSQTSNKFKVVIDAGHGDFDSGAVRYGFVEKKINLAIALKLGEILTSDKSIEVIFTRKDDTFIDLVERANIANRANANFFISIHCNSNKRSEPFGSETFVMGLSKSKSSLDVAMKENAVITLEDDYKTKYAGYDPNSPESLISATLAQEEYLDQSIELASKIQEGFANNLNRKSRGVSQAPFMVLHKAFMPRVLVETGFISNKEEGAYLNSEIGQENIAKIIANAVFKMKAEHFGGTVPVLQIIEPPKEVPKLPMDSLPKKENVIINKDLDSKKPIFKIQLAIISTKVELNPENFKGLNDLSYLFEGNLHKYMYGATNDYEKAKKLLAEAKTKGYGSAFIVAFDKDVKISLYNALKKIK